MRGMIGMLLVPVAVLMMFSAVEAAGTASGDCSFRKTLRKGGVVFEISSRPAAGCKIQIIEIFMKRAGKPVARFKSDADYLPAEAWAHDLDGDGMPELVMANVVAGNGNRGALDVYFHRDNSLRRTSLPVMSAEELAGYQGHDTFRLDKRQIVRSFPVYRPGDPAANPGGGVRDLRYEFREGMIHAAGQETPARATQTTERRTGRRIELLEPAAQGEGAKPDAVALPAEPAVAAVAASRPSVIKPNIEAIVIGASFIEIQAGAPVTSFKKMKLEKPERIAIDIPDATSALKGRSVAIGKFGIDRARIGQNKGFLRVVLDSRQRLFPPATITTSDKGLRIEFTR